MREKVLMMRALRGTTREPVMPSRRTKTARTTIAMAQGARSAIESMKSICLAAVPPTHRS